MICNDHPVMGKSFKKLIIVVEGIYSMEASICKLKQIIALKKKYAYLFLDEAHSVGAPGPDGRGVVDIYGMNPRDIDIMMGNFLKRFGCAGSYIAGNRDMIDFLKNFSDGMIHGSSLPPVVAQQIISSIKLILGENGSDEGSKRTWQLIKNTRYFRHELEKRGFIIYGHRDSPVVPLLLYHRADAHAFGNLMLQRGVGVVVVDSPDLPLMRVRVSFCISAAHTKEMLDEVLQATDEVGDILQVKYSRLSGPNAVNVRRRSLISTPTFG